SPIAQAAVQTPGTSSLNNPVSSPQAAALTPPSTGIARAEQTPSATVSYDQSAANPSQDPQAAIAAKIAPDLKVLTRSKPGDVIVQFRETPASSELVAEGFGLKAEFPILKAQLVTGKGADIDNLASRGNVAYISPDRKLRGALDHAVTAVNADIA